VGVRVSFCLDGMFMGVMPGDTSADRPNEAMMNLVAGDRAHCPAADAPYGMGGLRSLNGQDDQDATYCRESTHSIFLYSCRPDAVPTARPHGQRRQNRLSH
jgi:hypothetical protein